MLEIQLI